MTTSDPETAATVATPPLPVCGERTRLPGHLAAHALAFAVPGTAEPADVQHHLRCTLQDHTTGDHFAFVMELDGPGTGFSLWTRWTRGHHPSDITALPDCPAVSSPATGHEPCCEFADHPGAHTFGMTDPWAAFLPAEVVVQ